MTATLDELDLDALNQLQDDLAGMLLAVSEQRILRLWEEGA